MIAILQTIADLSETLTDGALFAVKSGGSAEITHHIYTMPPREITAADLPPFCLVKARDFSLYPGAKRQKIELLYCLYNDDRDAAMADIGRLAGLLEPLAVRGISHAGWKVQGLSGFSGDKETGVQPHPLYYLTVLMDLSAPPIKS
jgi:hypothetical protein